MRVGAMADGRRTSPGQAAFLAFLALLAVMLVAPAVLADANSSTANATSVDLDNAIWNFSSGSLPGAEDNSTAGPTNSNETNASENKTDASANETNIANNSNPAPASGLTNASAGQNQGANPPPGNSSQADKDAQNKKRARQWLEYSQLKKVQAQPTASGGTLLAFRRPKNFDELQYAVAARPQAYNFGQGDFAVFMWIKSDTENGGTLLSKTDYLEGKGYRLAMDSPGVIVFSITDGANYVETETERTFSDGAWHHVAAVRSGRSIRIYVDGEERASASGGRVIDASSNGRLSVGADMGDYDWSGTPRYQFAGAIQHVELIAYAPGAADIGAFFGEGMK